MGSSGYMYAMDYDGTMIMHPNKDEIFQKNILKTDIGEEILKNKTGIGEYKYNGVRKIVAYNEDKDMGLIYVANIPIDEFMGTSKTVVNIVLIMGVISAIVAVVLSVLIAKSLTNRINNVVVAMESLAKVILQIN